MRFSFAIVLAVAASSISATPIDASAQRCPLFCWIDINCKDCTWGLCKFPFCTSRQENISIGDCRSFADGPEPLDRKIDLDRHTRGGAGMVARKESKDDRGASESVLAQGRYIPFMGVFGTDKIVLFFLFISIGDI
ncbi:uncharacterized protein BJ212DRAFT_1590583 [Suillus subaureus]|uniref:Uncharacterized protein n=1 Tax=Suillus subaureus TaxID=48587 RepID=A0A9P7J7Y6_9AGAM|nr:uncharacterized protein BJ212DRAFT_1590583 [Suillus subaureus]KAG1807047.1 hypothetical protein BJ212DRAFT_1590583 [Suillus subaureus]